MNTPAFDPLNVQDAVVRHDAARRALDQANADRNAYLWVQDGKIEQLEREYERQRGELHRLLGLPDA
jgi:hypothetical protein